MEEEVFRELGLSNGETRVYFSLVRLGESGVGRIAKESGVSKSKIYDILNRLIDKGLAGYIIKNRVKQFLANDTHTLVEYVQKKEQKLAVMKKKILTLLPSLEQQRKSFSFGSFAEVTEGFHGLRSVREELLKGLKSGDSLLVFGAPRIANEKWESWFLNFHRRRESRGIRMKILYNSNVRDFGQVRKKFKLTKVRYLPNELVSPNWVDIYNECVLFCFVLKTPLALLVRDKSLADSFKVYFNIMWEASKA
ncbi:MAG: helix-turn-helix domain-containing protein [Candidatus Diapherotrites archaeon]|uniref:Helix-turn-helix domain-containing protein n=1 Tax=Candidatus Iainarchaeum sp. TaxID=3101447 RepID=A0A8T4L5Z5_9ARCH|nr:helix-turn-helix domain-containing protein [Candidatus Diapherotrites archaeon]